MSPSRKPNEKPIGWLIVINKECRDGIMEWFKDKMLIDAFEMELPEVGKVQMRNPPDGFWIDCRFKTKQDAMTALTNLRLFGLLRAEVPNRIRKFEVKEPLPILATPADLFNPEWEDAPWSIEMVFPVEETKPEPIKRDGPMHWVNTTQRP